MKTLTDVCKISDKSLIEPYVDGPVLSCWSFGGMFRGFAVVEKGIYYFLPVGSKVVHHKGELVCVFERYPISEPA